MKHSCPGRPRRLPLTKVPRAPPAQRKHPYRTAETLLRRESAEPSIPAQISKESVNRFIVRPDYTLEDGVPSSGTSPTFQVICCLSIHLEPSFSNCYGLLRITNVSAVKKRGAASTVMYNPQVF